VSRHIYFVVAPGFLLLDFAGPAEAFMYARRAGADFVLHFAGAEAGMAGALGLSLAALEPLPDALPPGAVVVLSGSTLPDENYRTPQAASVMRWLRRLALAKPVPRIACVCSAALLAAQAGLLDGRSCTTHHTLTARLRELAPQATVLEDRIFVDDGVVCTSAGITAGIDLALHLIEELSGAGIAQQVARDLVVYLRRTGSDPQLSPWLAFRNHLHPAVHRVQDAISRTPQREWALAELAVLAHTSVRNLTRLFRHHTGTSVVDYQQRLRIAHARQLLENPRNSLERVAELVGLSSTRSLRRVWNKVEGCSPAQARAGVQHH
jgi:transcriptional regulator GlxA family with amidase domain